MENDYELFHLESQNDLNKSWYKLLDLYLAIVMVWKKNASQRE